MLRVHFLGNLGNEPEVRHTKTGNRLVQLSVAVNSRRQNADGEWEDKTDWFRVRCMGNRADLAEKLAKGNRVFVEGSLDVDLWTGREGDKRLSLDVWADELVNLSPRPPQDAKSAPAEASTRGGVVDAAEPEEFEWRPETTPPPASQPQPTARR